jgi:hypothetical protein
MISIGCLAHLATTKLVAFHRRAFCGEQLFKVDASCLLTLQHAQITKIPSDSKHFSMPCLCPQAKGWKSAPGGAEIDAIPALGQCRDYRVPIVENLLAHGELEQGRQAFSKQYLQSENTIGFTKSNCCNEGWSMLTMYKHPMRNL